MQRGDKFYVEVQVDAVNEYDEYVGVKVLGESMFHMRLFKTTLRMPVEDKPETNLNALPYPERIASINIIYK